MTNETDRIQNAIRHIQTATDVDPWAMKIAVEAMQKQIPMKPKCNPNHLEYGYFCPTCGERCHTRICMNCGQVIDTEDET